MLMLTSKYMSRVIWSKSSFYFHDHSLQDRNAAASYSNSHFLRGHGFGWFSGEFISEVSNINKLRDFKMENILLYTQHELRQFYIYICHISAFGSKSPPCVLHALPTSFSLIWSL
jgi:hypothetical protein